METACWNQAKDDVQLTIELIKNQISTYSSQELDPPDQDLLMYLMASYIVTLMDRSRRPSLRQEQGTAISVDLEGDRDLTSLRTLLGSITQRISRSDTILKGSVLCGELRGRDYFVQTISPQRLSHMGLSMRKRCFQETASLHRPPICGFGPEFPAFLHCIVNQLPRTF